MHTPPIIQGQAPDQVYTQMKARNVTASTAKLSAAHVAIAGAGGLGSNIAIALARIGVGTLTLVDFDVIELSNLNRQQYKLSQVGMPKVTALKQNLQEFNPFITIHAYQEKLTPATISKYLSSADIICEAFDAPQEKAMLLEAVGTQFPAKPLVMATGMAGIHSANTITTKQLRPNLYIAGDGTSTGAEGLMAPRVMIAAGHEANMITRLILGKTTI